MQKILILTVVFCLFWACNNPETAKRGESNSVLKDTTIVEDTISTEIIKPVVNVYIENSGSMDGYVKGEAEFKGAIRDLLVLLKYHYDEDKINLFFINQQISKLQLNSNINNEQELTAEIDISRFVKDIELKWHNGSRNGTLQSTNLNKIFKMILGKTDNNTISILFSDCIYSIHGSEDTRELLFDEKSLTKDAFLTKWKKDKVPLATTIVKMKSKFNGIYYPYTGDNKGYTIKGERPYYICVIANQDFLADFNKNIELKSDKVKGFENKFTLITEKFKDSYFSVLQSTLNKGRFKLNRSKTESSYIHGIKDVKLLRGIGKLQFAVAVDFSNIQAENDYLTNPVNYTVITNNFIVKEIMLIDSVKINPIDKNRIISNNPTHIILLEAKTNAVSDVRFILKKSLPQWINESSTEDDTSEDKTKDKTFGLNYWVEGISEAYQIIYPKDDYFFECYVSID